MRLNFFAEAPLVSCHLALDLIVVGAEVVVEDAQLLSLLRDRILLDDGTLKVLFYCGEGLLKLLYLNLLVAPLTLHILKFKFIIFEHS